MTSLAKFPFGAHQLDFEKMNSNANTEVKDILLDGNAADSSAVQPELPGKPVLTKVIVV